MRCNSVKLTFTGDILCPGQLTRVCGGDYTQLFDGAMKELSGCDYLVGNLETPIAGEELGYTNERYCFNTSESFLAELKKCNFNMLSLANNHCMDRKEQGIVNTIKNCKKYGFDIVGLHAQKEEADEIFVKDINGIKIAFLNYTYGTNAFFFFFFISEGKKYMVNLFQPEETLEGSIHLLNSAKQIAEETKGIYDGGKYKEIVTPFLDKLKKDIKKAKKQSDYVIMLMHSGGQYNNLPDAYTRMLVDVILGEGVDFVVGNHPHIIQPSDFKNNTIFCLGNFMYASDLYPETEIDPSYNAVFHLTLEKSESGVKIKEKSFNVMHLNNMISNDDSSPKPYVLNSYYDENADKNKVLTYANNFVNENRYKNIESVYFI